MQSELGLDADDSRTDGANLRDSQGKTCATFELSLTGELSSRHQPISTFNNIHTLVQPYYIDQCFLCEVKMPQSVPEPMNAGASSLLLGLMDCRCAGPGGTWYDSV